MEPTAVYLDVTVDVDDTHEVNDVVGDRLLEMQVDEDLSINVPMEWPEARLRAHLTEQVAARRQCLVTSVVD